MSYPLTNKRTALSHALGWLTILTLLTLSACNKAPAEPPKPKAPATSAPPKVTAGGGDFVLRYFSPTTGSLLVAKQPADVPEGARAQVIVVPNDPKLHGPWLFVSDLTKKEGDTHPTRVVNRFEMEREREAAAPKAKAAGEEQAGEVILYKTAWCGYCKKAAAYLEAKGVDFETKDLERDAGARQDMMRRAQEAGFPASRLQGVPIIYIKGRILTGFSRDAIDQALSG